MLNYIWGIMMLFSTICAIFNGRIQQLTNAIFTGSESAVALCISLLATVSFWSGIMNVAKSSGVVGFISKILHPIFKRLFNISPNSQAAGAICMNISANMLGLSNAATPFGLEAMQLLNEQNPDKTTASDDMITFVLINTASVQIIPTTIAQIRAKYNAASPMDILLCVWLTSSFTLVFTLVLNAVLRRIKWDYLKSFSEITAKKK